MKKMRSVVVNGCANRDGTGDDCQSSRVVERRHSSRRTNDLRIWERNHEENSWRGRPVGHIKRALLFGSRPSSYQWSAYTRVRCKCWAIHPLLVHSYSYYAPLSFQWKTKVDTIFGYVNSLSLASMLNYPLTTPRLPVWCPLTDC